MEAYGAADEAVHPHLVHPVCLLLFLFHILDLCHESPVPLLKMRAQLLLLGQQDRIPTAPHRDFMMF
eukprot:scaffold329928_cov85-Tisochrysis_lutea.AAC.1